MLEMGLNHNVPSLEASAQPHCANPGASIAQSCCATLWKQPSVLKHAVQPWHWVLQNMMSLIGSFCSQKLLFKSPFLTEFDFYLRF
jgi:hypothetical protein